RDRLALATSNSGRLLILDKELDLEKMVALNPVGVWAVGAGGTILRSSDRGVSWVNVTSPMTNNLYAVCFASSWTGLAVGAGGTILRSTDKGATWTAQTAPGSADLYGVDMYSATGNCWAVGAGGAIHKSADGGINWTSITSPTTQDLKSVKTSFALSNQAYACGNGGVILKTTDGSVWSVLNSGTTENLNSIGITRHRNVPAVVEYGWAVGANGTILRTTDGGATWTPQVVPEASGKNLKSVTIVTSMIAKIVAEDGTVFRTKDGGATWSVTTSGAGALTSTRFVDPALGWAVGANGAAVNTKDGGATWTAQTTGVSEMLNGVFALDVVEEGQTIFSAWREVAFDAVGNLYAVDNNLEILRVYSPPDGPNSSTTKSFGVVVATTGDVTPPSVPVVNDDGDEQNSTTTLHASWTPSSDPESGVVEYACAISGVPMDIGRGYVAGWRSVGTATDHTFTGLDLKIGTYYVLVKARNGAGIWSDAGVSDGIRILLKYSTLGEIKAAKDTSVIFENDDNPCIVTYVDLGDLYGFNAEKWFWVEQLTPDGGLGAAGLKVNAVALGPYFPAGLYAGATITRMSGSLVLPTSQADTILDMTRELRLDSTPMVGEYTDLPPFLSMTTRSYGGGWRTNVANPGPGDGTPAVIGAWLDESHSMPAIGLNTEGLLVRVSGKVLGYGEDATKGWMWCYVDDGSGVPCEGGINGYKGIKVIKAWNAFSTFPRQPEDIGKQVIVEGICCNRYIPGSGRIRMMLMRSLPLGGDIDVLQFVNP
ncbi:MAG: WD40/YVTN/BNR-like repeat-containing protein, partial [Armatimonadota bacterium]